MQQDTKPDMKQMTGIDISGIIKTQPASAAPASKAGATTATGTAALYRSRHQMLLLVRPQAAAQMLM